MIDELKKQVFSRQATLRKIFESFGNQSLLDYANIWPVSPPLPASSYFNLEVRRLLTRIYSKELVDDVCEQLQKSPLISTIDHHGILNHPFFINSNLIFSLKNSQKYLICFGTSSISLNNSSWPGCLVTTDSDQKIKRFSFFPDKVKTQTVFSAAPLTAADTDRVIKEIYSDKILSLEQKQKFEKLINEVFRQKAIISQSSFSNQSCLISTALWEKFFSNAPRLIYLPIEDLVSGVIQNFICDDKNNVLHRLLFTLKGWEMIEKYFTGSLGAFSSEHKGSFLFWGINKKGRRVHLCRTGNEIKGSQYCLKLQPDKIKQALANRQLYPGTLVCFLVLLSCQITCLGGFNQVNWLTGIKENFLKLLLELGEVELFEKIRQVPTENFAEGNLAFSPRQHETIKATGIDIYLSGQNLYPKYQELACVLTLKQSIESLLPEIYRVIVPANQRDLPLLSLTDQEIFLQNGAIKQINKLLTE